MAEEREGLPQEARPRTGLYLISPPVFSLPEHKKALAAALSAGGVAAYQLRLKDRPDADILAIARELLPLCQAQEVAFILNDRADLAQAAGADGVHLGQEDGSLPAARALLGREAEIGVTCHASRHLAMEAGEQGANYVAFGAFFPSATKETHHVATPDILRWWVNISPIPCVAIGGITPENCGPLVAAGADFLAVSSAVWAGDPAAQVKAFAAAIDAAGRPFAGES